MAFQSIDVFEKLTAWAKRHFSEEQFAALRRHYLTARASLVPLGRLAYGSFDADELGRHLRERIGTNYEILMVHSSVNRLQPAYRGTPLDFVRMLVAFCGPGRTLAMPAFFFGDPGTGGAYETFQRRPTFDLLRTPSQMGLATELFRRTKGVMHSRHPVYRILALGPLARELTQGHEQADTSCGRGTPFDYMARHETQIIGIGKSIEVLTQVHHAEDLMGAEFPVPGRNREGSLVINLLENGDLIPFRMSGSAFEWRRNMGRLREIMNVETLKEWRFHNVPLFATRAGDVTAALIEAARGGDTIYERP